MTRFQFPRARARGAGNGRGPQVSPGTFEARSGPSSGPKPALPTAIVWSPGLTTPDVELWCFRIDGPGYQAVNAPVTDSLWLDQVPSGSEFQPPPGAAVDSIVTRDALIAYARARLIDEYYVTVALKWWKAQIFRPFPAVTPGVARKVAGGSIHHAAQIDRTSGTVPMAWVWVTDGGSREIWLLYRPGEVGGFAFAGSTPPGDPGPYDAAQMKFTRDEMPPNEYWDINAYAQAIAYFKALAQNTPDSPALHEDDLIVHDFRVEGL